MAVTGQSGYQNHSFSFTAIKLKNACGFRIAGNLQESVCHRGRPRTEGFMWRKYSTGSIPFNRETDIYLNITNSAVATFPAISESE